MHKFTAKHETSTFSTFIQEQWNWSMKLSRAFHSMHRMEISDTEEKFNIWSLADIKSQIVSSKSTGRH